jgi:hypothetical protein
MEEGLSDVEVTFNQKDVDFSQKNQGIFRKYEIARHGNLSTHKTYDPFSKYSEHFL